MRDMIQVLLWFFAGFVGFATAKIAIWFYEKIKTL
jgi:hypothetical protein